MACRSAISREKLPQEIKLANRGFRSSQAASRHYASCSRERPRSSPHRARLPSQRVTSSAEVRSVATSERRKLGSDATTIGFALRELKRTGAKADNNQGGRAQVARRGARARARSAITIAFCAMSTGRLAMHALALGRPPPNEADPYVRRRKWAPHGKLFCALPFARKLCLKVPLCFIFKCASFLVFQNVNMEGFKFWHSGVSRGASATIVCHFFRLQRSKWCVD